MIYIVEWTDRREQEKFCQPFADKDEALRKVAELVEQTGYKGVSLRMTEA